MYRDISLTILTFHTSYCTYKAICDTQIDARWVAFYEATGVSVWAHVVSPVPERHIGNIRLRNIYAFADDTLMVAIHSELELVCDRTLRP